MNSLIMESVVIAFMIGGIVGAVTALQLANSRKKVPVKIKSDRSPNR